MCFRRVTCLPFIIYSQDILLESLALMLFTEKFTLQSFLVQWRQCRYALFRTQNACFTDQTCPYSPETIPRSSECHPPSDSRTDLHIFENGNDATRRTSTPLSLDEAEKEDCEEVFTFSSCPHSARRGQPFSVAFKSLSSDLKADDLGWERERKEACLEDDFIGSEGEEVDTLTHKHT